MQNKLNISWYGRCCFLIEYGGRKILFDPYDAFCNVEVGRINADITLISSTWHDHGHIGASPDSHIYSYSGSYENGAFKITGVESLEDRGTSNIIFNLQYGPFSITNFADFGPEQKDIFEKSLTPKEREILNSTNIAFIRPSIVRDEVGEVNEHNEVVLEFCNPSLIFPEHYFPRSFVDEQVPDKFKEKFIKPNIVVDEMISLFNYPVEKINDYKAVLGPDDLKQKKLIKFLKLHPQVKYQQS